MEVILLEDIVHLGKLGSVVKVKPGYARNYLIPQGKVKKATPSAVEEFRLLRAEFEKTQAEKLAQAEALGAQLSGLTLQMVCKAGVDGRLFGSVTQQDIAEELKKMGFAITKSVIHVPSGHLKQVGEYDVTLNLHAKVCVVIRVAVLGDH